VVTTKQNLCTMQACQNSAHSPACVCRCATTCKAEADREGRDLGAVKRRQSNDYARKQANKVNTAEVVVASVQHVGIGFRGHDGRCNRIAPECSRMRVGDNSATATELENGRWVAAGDASQAQNNLANASVARGAILLSWLQQKKVFRQQGLHAAQGEKSASDRGGGRHLRT
jgi:hypothetical protein